MPIRSLETHLPFEGVEVGDIGTKLGYNGMDNGFLSFNKYRTPRENLLSRFVNVDKQGNFEVRGDPRAVYSIMMLTRVGMIGGSWFALARSALISIRYAVCRRQFKTIKGSREERKLLDYQTHMAILGPYLASSFIIKFVGMTFAQLSMKSNDLVLRDNNYEMLEMLHHFSSGFKSYMTDHAIAGMDEMRQACGGAGFHLASGVALHWANSAPLATYEGVNTVMMQ